MEISSISSILTLGGRYSNSHKASIKFRERNSIKAEIELLVPRNKTKTEGVIEELSKRYANGETSTIAIVPIRNTIEGRVVETIGPYRGLMRYLEVKICDEFWMGINHYICAAPDTELEDLKSIVSHPQVLGQCSRIIELLKLDTIEATSTAEAARGVLDGEYEESAAICSIEAAEEYGLKVLARDVGNKYNETYDNSTLFVVLSNKDCEKPTGCDKTTITCELKGASEAGTLNRALRVFSKKKISLSRIESMDKGSKNEYVFWMDADDHRENMKRELEELGKISESLNIHGSYPREVTG